MSYKPHDLVAEFPEDQELLRQRKLTKGHFAVLADRYQEVNHAIVRIESELDPASDARLEDLKKERLSLLDQIGAQVREARAAPA